MNILPDLSTVERGYDIATKATTLARLVDNASKGGSVEVSLVKLEIELLTRNLNRLCRLLTNNQPTPTIEGKQGVFLEGNLSDGFRALGPMSYEDALSITDKEGWVMELEQS